jgi:hypothetical protein
MPTPSPEPEGTSGSVYIAAKKVENFGLCTEAVAVVNESLQKARSGDAGAPDYNFSRRTNEVLVNVFVRLVTINYLSFATVALTERNYLV